MPKSLPLAVALLALAAAPVPAHPPRTGAWQLGNNAAYHLYYEDLDVGTRAGRAVLLRRVRAVADKLCQSPTRADEQACVADIVASLNKPEIALALREEVAVAGR